MTPNNCHAIIDYSKNYVKPGTHDVHTESIEGRWFCIKRWLPSSGKYKVEEYLPVYLWTIHHKKQSNNLFWELLSLLPSGLKKTENNLVDEVLVQDIEVDEIVPKVSKVPREKLPCLYCGGEYGGNGGLKRHLNYCKLNMNATKKIKLASPVEDIPEIDNDDSSESDIEEYPCLYCEGSFPTQELFTSHLVSCSFKTILS